MPILFYDSIQGMNPGDSGPPPGFVFLGSSGFIQPFSAGGAFPSHLWLQYTGPEMLGSLNAPHPEASVTFWFAYKTEADVPNGPIFQTYGFADPSLLPETIIRTFNLSILHDATLGINVGPDNDFFASTGNFPIPWVIQRNVWYFFQVSLEFGFTAIGLPPTNFQNVTVNLFIDGESIFSGDKGISNFSIDSNFLNKNAGCLPFSFSQPNFRGASGLGEIYAAAGTSTSPIYPGNLWSYVVDVTGSGYSAGTTILVAKGDASAAPVIDKNTGAITSVIPIGGTWFGDSYGPGDLPVLLTAHDPLGGGSGFQGHATITPIPNRRVNQFVVEAAQKPSTANVRVPQFTLEYCLHPAIANIRVPQMVIELAKKPEAIISGGQVTES